MRIRITADVDRASTSYDNNLHHCLLLSTKTTDSAVLLMLLVLATARFD